MTTSTPELDALRRAIATAGGPAKLAAALDLHRSAPSFWLRTRLPPRKVLDVERVTGVPRHELRPDIYPVSGAAS